MSRRSVSWKETAIVLLASVSIAMITGVPRGSSDSGQPTPASGATLFAAAAPPGTPVLDASAAGPATTVTPALAKGDCSEGVLTNPSPPYYALTCNVRKQAENGLPSRRSAVFSLPEPVVAGWEILTIDPNQANSNVANWSEGLHFIPDSDGLARSFQLLSQGCGGGPAPGACFPSYSTVVSGPNGFEPELQYGNQADSEDVTVYYAAPNTYNIYSASRFGPPRPAIAAGFWAIRHLYGQGSKVILASDPHDRYLSVGTAWSGLCLGFVDTAWEAGFETFGVSPPAAWAAEDGYVGGAATATGDYNVYNSQGLVHTQGVPPFGALVFFPYPYYTGSGGAGHIGISIGNGYMISALASVETNQITNPVSFLGPGQAGAYAGWAYPPAYH